MREKRQGAKGFCEYRIGVKMIKVSFFSKNPSDDVCALLERDFTKNMCIEDWLIIKIPSLKFDCMDFPNDLPDRYDCYFTSGSEENDAIDVCRLLKESPVGFTVGIVDDNMNFIKEITEVQKNADRL